ncbi:hypothetical protein [Mesorhizobium sp.]|uniref:hypothetical protein n=1 Tax=Mesorhizobium sp. TaxID=1871066 RepID=UPI0025EF64F5|nr:hypothetical protein [Mesorhizobium sp.]
MGLQRNAFARSVLATDLSADPAVAVWRKWQAAHEQTERLCRQQQNLERKLAETVGFPGATIRLRDGESVRLHSLRAVREVLDLGPEDVAMRAKAAADFAAHQARWDAGDREIGYSAALHAEREAADRAEDLLEMLSQTPAASLGGAVAKLDAVLREGEVSEDCDEFPWPQIRSALDDVIRIGQRLVPAHASKRDAPTETSSKTGRERLARLDRGKRRRSMKKLTDHSPIIVEDSCETVATEAVLGGRSVIEVADAARVLWGDLAVTAIAWGALVANCEGDMPEYRFWFQVFDCLQAGSSEAAPERMMIKARRRSFH